MWVHFRYSKAHNSVIGLQVNWQYSPLMHSSTEPKKSCMPSFTHPLIYYIKKVHLNPPSLKEKDSSKKQRRDNMINARNKSKEI